MTKLSEKLGKRIKEIRESRGLKQWQFAEMLEMESSNLTRIESGKQIPKEENLEKIAELLGVQVKDLFDFEHKESRERMIDEISSKLDSIETHKIEFIYKFMQCLDEYTP